MSKRSLLLKDIVEVAQLRRETARHILSHHTVLDVPRATGQGAYRKFTAAEGCRLVNAARLVRFGMPLLQAEEAVGIIELDVKERTQKGENPNYPFASGSHWWMKVVNARYIRAHRDRRPRQHMMADAHNRFYDLEIKEWGPLEEYGVMPLLQWDLTELGERLQVRANQAQE